MKQEIYTVDAETGEIIEVADAPFAVTDESSAEWVLEKRLDALAERARIEIKRKAINENLDAEIKALDRRVEWLDKRFGPELEAFAREQLEGKKTRTLKLTYGSISFRTVKGGVRVVDNDQAVESAQKHGFDHAVKVTKSLQISKLSEFEKDLLWDTPGFEKAPDRETMKIDSGVGS